MNMAEAELQVPQVGNATEAGASNSQVATIIRWVLRAVLVAFLAWLLRSRSQEDEEEEDQVEEDEPRFKRGVAKSRGQPSRQNGRGQRGNGRDPYGGRDQYNSPGMRQRRPGGDAVDFDDVINKMSKPKTMWEIRKSGEAPQIFKRPSVASMGEVSDTTPKAASAVAKDHGKEMTKADSGSGRELSQGERVRIKQEEANALLKKTMLHGHTRPVTFITWNRDCNLLFTCSKDKTVCVWSFPDGEQLGSYIGHDGAIWSCSVTVDSSWLVSSGADRLVIVWEARTSRELSRLELPGVARCVEWARGGNSSESQSERFVTAHNKFASHPASLTVFRFDGSSSEELLRISTLPTTATQVRWAKGDNLLASSHENGELIFWLADTGAQVRRLKAHESLLSKFDFSSDYELVATASLDMTVKVWDLSEGTSSEASDSGGTLLYSAETDRPLNAVALGPLTRDAAVAAVGQRPGSCCVIAAGGQDARDVALSNSTGDQFDTLLFRLGDDESAPRTLQADGTSKGHFGPVHTLAFASDGSVMASGSEDGIVRLHIFVAPATDPVPEEAS